MLLTSKSLHVSLSPTKFVIEHCTNSWKKISQKQSHNFLCKLTVCVWLHAPLEDRLDTPDYLLTCFVQGTLEKQQCVIWYIRLWKTKKLPLCNEYKFLGTQRWWTIVWAEHIHLSKMVLKWGALTLLPDSNKHRKMLSQR